MYYERALVCPEESFFLLGPRGTGKSTWLHRQFPKAKLIDLLDERQRFRLMSQPGAFALELEALQPGSWVIVDEIQKMPDLLNEVHRFIESRRLKFALCGSSARKLRKAGVNLLAGRALSRTLYPFQPDELPGPFDVEDALRYGTLPVAWGSPAREEKLDAYIMTYLKEEVQAEALVRNLPGFARFIAVAALLHGQAINATNIARDCGISRPTVEAHLDILEQTLLCVRLRAYEGKLRVKERKHPKLFWIDPGLVRAAKQQLQPTLAAEERGHLFEGLVCTTLLAYRDYRRAFADLRYWAAGSSPETEVDFLAIRDDRMVAIEVKSGAVFNETWCKGLRAFGTPPGVVRRLVVCPDTPDMRLPDGIEVLSYRRLASLLQTGTLFDV
ncbi:MAG: ATP-binding protein [Lentisphaerae bacterium]|jgi:predicted AAA+ superfamily ATPase|nr:ATP-binding protein [Lentisphaerota bacterium]